MIPPDANLGTASGDLRQETGSDWVASASAPTLRMLERPDVPLLLSEGTQSLLSLRTDHSSE